MQERAVCKKGGGGFRCSRVAAMTSWHDPCRNNTQTTSSTATRAMLCSGLARSRQRWLLVHQSCVGEQVPEQGRLAVHTIMVDRMRSKHNHDIFIAVLKPLDGTTTSRWRLMADSRKFKPARQLPCMQGFYLANVLTPRMVCSTRRRAQSTQWLQHWYEGRYDRT